MDIVMLVVTSAIAIMASYDTGSWLFGIVLALAGYGLALSWSRWLFGSLFDLPVGDRNELVLLAKQTTAVFLTGMLVAAIKFLVEPTPRGVADPLNLALLVIITVPVTQNAVKARHVFTYAVRRERARTRRKIVGSALGVTGRRS